MATVAGEGTTTADGTEQTLFSSTNPITAQLYISLANMMSGDAVTIRIKTKVLSAGTLRTVYTASFTDAQSAPDILQISPPVPSGWELVITLEQTAGTNRDYAWRVDTLGAVTVVASGTHLATGSEDTVVSTTANGTYVWVVDLGNMAGTDQVTLRMKETVRSGGTKRTAFDYTPASAGPQTTPDILMVSLPVSAAYGADGTLEQTAGTNRNYPNALYRVAA